MEVRSRIACLRIPRFQIAVHQKDNPALKGRPFIIVSGHGSRTQVVMCSQEATRKQVFAGMKLSEAKAVCADLVWVEQNEPLYKQAHSQLCRELIACSPKVSVIEPGVILIDASGLSFLGGERRFCLDVDKRVGCNGYTGAHIGIADSAFAATVASKFKKHRHYIVESGGDAEFLAPLSIKHLPISLDMLESLDELGLRAIGQVLSLDQQSLMERFGKEGTIAYQLARGIDVRRPLLPAAQKEFKASIDLGSPIELLNEIQFVLKSMIDHLVHQLKDEGWWAEELTVAFYSDDELIERRPIKLLQPSNHAKFLLEVMKLSLESSPLQREVTSMTLAISRFSKEAWQQLPIGADNYRQEEQDEHQTMSLTLMLQRFISRLGEDVVVKSVPNDQHIPERAAAWLSVINKPPTVPVVPVNISYISAYAAPAGLVSGLALRMLPAPQPVLVDLNDETPDAIAFAGRWYRVQEITVPERLSGLWWEQPVRKSYFIAMIRPREHSGGIRTAGHESSIAVEVQHDSTLLVLLVHDHEQNGWFINGIYD